MTADLTQSLWAVKGSLQLDGSVTYDSPLCSERFSIVRSYLYGRLITLDLKAQDGTTTTIYGNVSSDATHMELADYDTGCGGVGGRGVLERQ